LNYCGLLRHYWFLQGGLLTQWLLTQRLLTQWLLTQWLLTQWLPTQCGLLTQWLLTQCGLLTHRGLLESWQVVPKESVVLIIE
jgi:hypothetical protein